MNKNPILSIIVPVYNAETYLRRCIDSILAQTYTDFEVICINDGSSDSSKEILEEYASKDTRIIIINQSNKGAGAARNAGLKIMRGTYVGFVDADDWIEPAMYEYMIQKLIENKVDSVVCGFKLEGDVYLQKRAEDMLESFISQKVTKFDIDYLNIGIIPVSMWKLLKTEIIKKYNLEFPEGIAYEDNAFSWCYMSLSKNTMLLNNENERFYHYFKHATSLTSNSQEYPKIMDLLTNVEKFLEHSIKHNILDKFSSVILMSFMIFYNEIIDVIPPKYNLELVYRMNLFLQFIDLDLCLRHDLLLINKNIKLLKAFKKNIVYYLSMNTKNIKINVEKSYKPF